MTQTVEISATANTWVQLSNGEPNVMVQIVVDDLIVCVAQAQPNSGSRVGHKMGINGRVFSFGALEAGDQVWAFSTGITQAVTVTK